MTSLQSAPPAHSCSKVAQGHRRPASSKNPAVTKEQPVVEFSRLTARPESTYSEGNDPLNATVVIAELRYPEASLIESQPEAAPVTAAELVARLSRDMERIELALRKLMLLR